MPIIDVIAISGVIRPFQDDFRQQAKRAQAGVEVDLTALRRLSAPIVPDVKTIVFGGKAVYPVCGSMAGTSMIMSPSIEQVIDFCHQSHPAGWEREMSVGLRNLAWIKLMPMYALSATMNDWRVRQYAQRAQLPCCCMQERLRFTAPLEYTLPHLDPVAIRYPNSE